jgi:hypothetical protein
MQLPHAPLLSSLQGAAPELRVENNGIPPLPSQSARQQQQQVGGGLFGRNW